MGIQEVSKSIIYHTNTCNYCGINWCSNYERNSPDVESLYNETSISLQTRGCSGVSSAWAHARNSRTGTVYAVAPAGTGSFAPSAHTTGSKA